MFLHGCVGPCKTKVWEPQDPADLCELCGTRRYDDKENAREFVVHFPLKERFESLLKCEQYCNSVRWESQRERINSSYMTGLSQFSATLLRRLIGFFHHLFKMFTTAQFGKK